MMTLSRCPDEGMWRAYLDGQLSATEQTTLKEHLSGCGGCAETIARSESQATLVYDALTQAASHEPATGAAWQRFRTRHLAPARYPLNWRLRTMWQSLRFRSWRPALLGALLVTLVVSVMAIAPLRTAASQFLGIFRVRKFAVISIDPAQVRNLAGFEQQVFSQPQVSEVEPVEVAGADEASLLAGFRVLVPGRLPDGSNVTPQFVVVGATSARTEVNLAAARALLQMANLPTDAIPADRETVEVTADIPPVVTLSYGRGAAALTIIQARSPEVNVPEGIDLARVGEVGLQLLGLSPQEAQRLSRSIDWATTLIIPVPTDIASVREVTVRGVSGYLIGQRSGNRPGGDPDEATYGAYTLIWEERGVLYAVIGNMEASVLTEVAESLR
ncbi:MAG: zf-HC2 domain-containing protein [Anaerolineae bacterium]|nr:zf-HC2 domain-containing protein [Anaerolineae bacterium]